MIWGIATLPRLGPVERIGTESAAIPAQDRLHDEFERWHAVGGWITLFLVLLHVAGASKHQFVDRTNAIGRMWPWRRHAVTAAAPISTAGRRRRAGKEGTR